MTTATTFEMLPYALDYASRHWHVFPIYTVRNGKCACGQNCDTPAKHPMVSGGVYAATIRLPQIKEWWSKWPDANIGIATGQVSGIFVVDVDTRHDGEASLQELVKQYGIVEGTPLVVITGGGGRHILFEHPGLKIPNKVKLADGLDIRGDGGYIVAPPSLHISGQRYRWLEGTTP